MVRSINDADHLAFIRTRSAVSFLQTPAWATVKNEWRGESIGWFDGDELVGAGLVLYRQLPKLKRFLAYLPEGPDIDWTDPDLARWLDPMTVHLKSQGAFGIRIGPAVVGRRWHAATIKQAIADPALNSLSETPADAVDDAMMAVPDRLRRHGWRCLLYTSPSPRDGLLSRMPSSA